MPGRGRAIGLGLSDGTVRLWNTTTGTETARFAGHFDSVNALCSLPDGGLASCSSDRSIRLWNVNAGTEVARLKGHTNHVNALCLLPDGRLTSGSSDNTIRLWDIKTGTEIARIEGDARVRTIVAVAPSLIAAGDQLGLHWLEVID